MVPPQGTDVTSHVMRILSTVSLALALIASSSELEHKDHVVPVLSVEPQPLDIVAGGNELAIGLTAR